MPDVTLPLKSKVSVPVQLLMMPPELNVHVMADADTKVTLPRGVGTRSPEEVAGAVLRAIRDDPAEITVAAFEQSLGALLAGISHSMVASIQRRFGGTAVAKQIAAAQAHKR